MSDECFLHQGGLLYPGRIISQNPETLATIFQSADGCCYPCVPSQIITDRRVAHQLCISYLEYWSKMQGILWDETCVLPGEEE